jgi:hypothetical protein
VGVRIDDGCLMGLFHRRNRWRDTM